MKNVLISTGGSGGHVIPALTIYDHISKKFKTKISTDKRGLKYIDKTKYKTFLIDIPNITNSIIKFPLNIIKFVFSIFYAFKYLKKNQIDILISTGGYMSLPFCLASILNKNKIFLFEPNKVIGRSNKFMLRFADRIICYYDDIVNFPTTYQGRIYKIDYLLRKNFYKINKNQKMISKKLNLLILGGSQGSSFFDKLVISIVKKIHKQYKINIVQQISDRKNISFFEEQYKRLEIKYSLFDFNQDIAKKYSKANIVITRCGASALAETSFMSTPFIAIPFPYAKDNHQLINAKYFSDLNCCWLYNQDDKTEKKILDLFKKITKYNIDYNTKSKNLLKFSYKNNWNNISNKLIKLIDEN